MITQQEIGRLAAQVAEMYYDDWESLIRHLNRDDAVAVVERAAEIARGFAKAEASMLENIQRLAVASGCPENVAVIPWLIERGLIVIADGGLPHP